MKFAVIQTGGKQYKVSAGQKLKVEKIPARIATQGVAGGKGEKDANFVFDKVLLVADGEKVSVGAPHVDNAKVEAKILRQAKDKKVIVFKYQSKTRRRRKKGHRQQFTEVEIVKINE